MLVAGFYPVHYLLEVVGAEMGDEACLSTYFLQQLILGIFPAEAEVNQVGCRQSAGPLRRERTFAV